MRYRTLRIAWSVAWGMVAVLLIVFWVRSHHSSDTLVGRFTSVRSFNVDSIQGSFGFALFEDRYIHKLEHVVEDVSIYHGYAKPSSAVGDLSLSARTALTEQ
jgi:hypothetical protein